jgi:hypothetical protein
LTVGIQDAFITLPELARILTMSHASDVFATSIPLDQHPAPSAGADSLGESGLRGARRDAVGAVTGATWGSVLWLLENPYAMTHGLPARFSRYGDSPPPLAQFEEWPEVWQAAVALGLRKPGMQHQDVPLAVTNLLLEHYSDEEMRRLPLSTVVVFLRRKREQGIRTEQGVPPVANSDRGRPGWRGVCDRRRTGRRFGRVRGHRGRAGKPLPGREPFRVDADCDDPLGVDQAAGLANAGLERS